WKPSFFFKIEILKKMISFSIWSMLEAISIWLTTWVDTLIIGTVLSGYYLGIYKNSLSMVNSLLSVITASIAPVLFSSLSRLQKDNVSFQNFFFKAQKMVAYFVLPLGVGIFLYSDLITYIMFGSKWLEASPIIGVWALTSCVTIVFAHLNGEVFRAKGLPKLSFVVQIIHLVFLIPTCLISVQYGFWSLVYARSFIRLQYIFVSMLAASFIIQFKIKNILKNVMQPFIFTLLMTLFAIVLQQVSKSMIWSIISIIFCALFYLMLMVIFAKQEIKKTIQSVIREKN
ncbi:MAG: oligosaccharide flippase family protein, partial [Oscillospiraceae bacterium]